MKGGMKSRKERLEEDSIGLIHARLGSGPCALCPLLNGQRCFGLERQPVRLVGWLRKTYVVQLKPNCEAVRRDW